MFALRETYATQSQAINADAALTPAKRREQLTALDTQAKNEAAAKLGQEGAEAFAQRSAWIGMLNRGRRSPPIRRMLRALETFVVLSSGFAFRSA